MINNYNRLYIFLLVLFSAFLVSCEQDINYKYTSLSLTNGDFEVCSTQECPSIEVLYIRFTEPKSLEHVVDTWVEKSISETLFEENTPQKPVKEAIATYITNSQNGYPETIEYSTAHEFTADFVVSYSSNKIVSLVYFSHLFDGGAHGFDSTTYANFDPKKGVQYVNNGLVTEDFYAFAKAEFQRSYPNITFEINSQSFAQGSLHQLGFSEEGVVLLYIDEYAFPIAEGDYKITIPWAEAEAYLTI